MNIDDVRNKILSDADFREEFKSKGAAASDSGLDSAEWLDFENYFADDPDTLGSLRAVGAGWSTNQFAKAAAIVTGSTGCNTNVDNASDGDPFFP